MPETNDIVPSSDIAEPFEVKLARRVKTMPRPCYAVMDGARFPDLPGSLRAAGLPHRSLFLNHADLEVEKAGFWLVSVRTDAEIETVIQVLQKMPAAVFWSCPDGEASLHRHLRTINLVIVPLPIDGGAPEVEEGAVGGDIPQKIREETVIFRHADPNVMASLLPLLDPAQFARVFGPASFIVMGADDYGGVRRAPKPDDLPIAPRGPLRLRVEQMAALEEAKSEKSRRKVAAYLRDINPVATSTMSESELSEFVTLSERSGLELGLQSERPQGLWASMMLASRCRVSEERDVRAYLQADDRLSADEKVRRLVDHLSHIPERASAI